MITYVEHLVSRRSAGGGHVQGFKQSQSFPSKKHLAGWLAAHGPEATHSMRGLAWGVALGNLHPVFLPSLLPITAPSAPLFHSPALQSGFEFPELCRPCFAPVLYQECSLVLSPLPQQRTSWLILPGLIRSHDSYLLRKLPHMYHQAQAESVSFCNIYTLLWSSSQRTRLLLHHVCIPQKDVSSVQARAATEEPCLSSSLFHHIQGLAQSGNSVITGNKMDQTNSKSTEK